MAKNDLEIKILCAEYRPCFANGKKALFHRWTEKKEIVSPSVMCGGHSGGQIQQTFGLVEFEDGSVAEVYPNKIKFVPGKLNQYAFPEEPSSEPKSERSRIFKEEKVCCPFCEGNNKNAVLVEDTATNDFFVYCQKCEIETEETFEKKEMALNAFSEGKTRYI